MADFREDEILGKAYDSRLMRRLLQYAKPYWHFFFISIVLVFLVTAMDIVQPYLIKIAIDNHIIAYDRPLLSFAPEEAPGEGVRFRDRIYIPQDRLTDAEAAAGELYQIVLADNHYYLIKGTAPIGTNFSAAPLADGSDVWILTNTDVPTRPTYEGYRLSKAELRHFRAEDVRAIGRLGLLYLGVVVFGFVVNYIQTNLLAYTGQKIIFNIRTEVFNHVENLSVSFFDRNPVGRLVTRVTNDVETLNEMYTDVLVNLFRDIFTILGAVIVMLQLNWKLTLIILTVLPIVAITSIIFRSKVREAYRETRRKLSAINATLAENFSGMRIIQIFAQEAKKSRQFDKINREHLNATMNELKIFAVFRPFMEFLSNVALALLLWFGGRAVIGGSLQFGVLYAFIDYIGRLFNPINALTDKYNIMQSAMASSERIFQILDQKTMIKNPEYPKPLPEIKGRVEFKNVWFAYNDEEWVLKDISFTAEPGETIAFVGATGAGKTSIINVLNRLYDIQKGQILIDGIDIRHVRKEDLRRQIAVVLQDVFLFTGDIKSNIRLNEQTISDEKVMEVARYVNADKFIEKLPGKLDEPVTERGSTLSMGQRQLLAFARALAFDPKILVLDEATANIDTETEILIQDALRKLTKGRTTFVIAHRLSTIQQADKIIVLHKGQIREVGTHQELLKKRGIYYKLYQLQYKDQLLGEQEAKDADATA